MNNNEIRDFFNDIFGENLSLTPKIIQIQEEDKDLFCKIITNWKQWYNDTRTIYDLGVNLESYENKAYDVLYDLLELTFKDRKIVNIIAWYIIEREYPDAIDEENPDSTYLKVFLPPDTYQEADDISSYEIDISTPELFWDLIQQIIKEGINPAVEIREIPNMFGDDEDDQEEDN
jgi:hypothetical protein